MPKNVLNASCFMIIVVQIYPCIYYIIFEIRHTGVSIYYTSFTTPLKLVSFNIIHNYAFTIFTINHSNVFFRTILCMYLYQMPYLKSLFYTKEMLPCVLSQQINIVSPMLKLDFVMMMQNSTLYKKKDFLLMSHLCININI